MNWSKRRATRAATWAIRACAAVLVVDLSVALWERDWRHALVGAAAVTWLALNVSDRVDVV